MPSDSWPNLALHVAALCKEWDGRQIEQSLVLPGNFLRDMGTLL
jgi:hypothetical protein